MDALADSGQPAKPQYVAQPPTDEQSPLGDIFQSQDESKVSIVPDPPEELGGVQGDPNVRIQPAPATAADPNTNNQAWDSVKEQGGGAAASSGGGSVNAQAWNSASEGDLGDIFAKPDAPKQRTTSTPEADHGDLGDIFAPASPSNDLPTSGTMANHGNARAKIDGRPGQFASELLPKDVKIASVRDGGSASVDTLRDAVLDATYNMKKMAEKDGYKLLVTSGTDGGHAQHSFHYRGEAVDVRILDKNGKDLPRDKESQLGVKYADSAGFGSMIDELHFTPGGRAKAVGDNPHMHLAWGNELGSASIATTQFRTRTPGDANYYKSYSPTKATMVQRADPLTRQAQIIATQVGVDPDVFGRLVSQESAWNPNAHSGAGAFGLTQLMPETAMQLAKDDGHTLEEIKSDPKLQLLYGAKYLKKMIDDPASGGSYARALAAYNAGPGGRDTMLKNGHMYGETKNYVYNILHDLDSANMKTPEDAAAAFQAGTGYMHQADHIDHQRKALVNDVVAPMNSLFSRMTGADNLSDLMGNVGNIYNDPNNPSLMSANQNPNSRLRQLGSWMGPDTFMGRLLSGPGMANPLGEDANTTTLGQLGNAGMSSAFQVAGGMTEMANQFLHHFSFGIAPESNVIHEIGEKTSGLEKVLSYGVPQMASMIPAMDMTMGWMAGKVARTLGVVPKTLGLAEDASLNTIGHQYLRKAFSGGYGATTFPTLAAAGTVGAQGFLQAALEKFGDYYHNPTPEGDAMSMAEKVQHSLGAGIMGAGFNMLLGAVLPGAATAGESILRGMTVGELATAKGMAELPFLKRAGGGLLRGAGVGGTTAAVGNLLGIDEAIVGHPVSGQDAVLGGITVGGLGGSMVYGGLPFGIRALEAAAKQSPVLASALDASRAAFSKMSTAASEAIGASLTEIKSKLDRQTGTSMIKTVAGDMATRIQEGMGSMDQVHQALGESIKQNGQTLQQAQEHVAQIKKQIDYATADPNFAPKMTEYKNLQSTLAQEQAQLAQLRANNPADPQTQAAAVREAAAQKKLMDFTSGDDTGVNRKVAQIFQSQKDMEQISAQIPQQQEILAKKNEKFGQLSAGLAMGKEAQQNHLDVLNEFQKINSDPTQTPIYQRTNDQLMDLWREKLDTSHHSNSDFFKYLSQSAESGLSSLVDGAKVDGALPKDLALSMAKRIDDGYAQEALTLLKATRDPNSAYGQIVMKNIKAINPWLSEITPQFDVNYHRAQIEHEALSSNPFSASYKTMKTPRGGDWTQDRINQWVNEDGRLQKLKYDYGSTEGTMKVAQVRPSMVQDYVKQVADKYGVESDTFAPDRVNPQHIMDNLGDIQKKGLPVLDMESITARLAKGGDRAGAISDLHQLYDQAVVAERAGDTHVPMGSSKQHLDNIRRDVFKANQDKFKGIMEEKAQQWKKIQEGLAAEVVPAFPGASVSSKYGAGAYTDLMYNPEYVLRSAYRTADVDTQLRSRFTIDPTAKTFKFDNKLVTADFQGELNRLDEFNKMIVGKEQTKSLTPEVTAGVGVDRNTGPAKHYVLDSTRQNLVEGINDAAHSDAKSNRTFDDLINPEKGVGFLADDKNSTRNFKNMMMSEVLNPEGHQSIEQVRGWTAANYTENIFNRMKAGNAIAAEIHTNFGDLITRSLDTINESRKAGESSQISPDAFMRDIRDVLEGSASLKDIREKYKGPNGETQHIDAVVGYSNRIKSVVETMKAANPALSDFMRPLYFHAMFPDAAAKMATHGTGSNIGGLLGSENLRGFKTLKDLEGWVQESKQEIKTKMGLTGRTQDGGTGDWSSESFENMPIHERINVLENMSTEAQAQLKATNPEKYQKIVDRVNEKSLAYLYEKPLVDLPHVMTAEFRAALHADSWRKTMQFLKNSPVDLSGKGADIRNMLEVFEKSDKQTDIQFQGPKGEHLRYQSLADLPGMRNFRTEIATETGSETVRGDQIMLHPEAFNFFKNNLNPSPTTLLGPLAKTPLAQALSKMHNISRNMNLMGTWIPHLVQAQGAQLAGWMTAPLEAASIVPLGRKIMDGTTDSRQLMLHAIRSGVNSRGMDQSCRFLAKEVATALGSDITSKLYGVAGDKGNRFLQSLDSRDVAQGDAYNALSPTFKAASDFLGGGAEFNHLQLQHSLYSAIEAGMFGSFYHEIGTMQKAMGGTLAEMDQGVQTQVLEKTAAQLTNMRAGALPYFMTPTAFRQELGEIALAPGWVTSKANMIIDAFDGALGLGQKTLGAMTGKTVDPAELKSLGDLFAKAGFQKRYEGYSPEMKMYIRERMAQGVGSLLVAGAGMSIAFNMMKNGAPPWRTNPPDKMFHLRVGDTYWSNPLMVGSVRDIMRFIGDYRQTDKDMIAKIGDSISNLVERNLSPDIAAIEQWGRGKDEDGKPITVDAREGNWSIPQRVGDYTSYIARKAANWEGMTGTKDNPHLADLLRQNPDYMVKTQTPTEYLARTAGSYDSYYSAPQHVAKDFKDRVDQYRFQLVDRIEGVAKAARMEDDPAKRQTLMRMIPQINSNGAEFRDTDLKKAYASQGGKLHLSPEEVMNIVQRVMNPAQYVLKKDTAKTANGALAGQSTVNQIAGEQQSKDWWNK